MTILLRLRLLPAGGRQVTWLLFPSWNIEEFEKWQARWSLLAAPALTRFFVVVLTFTPVTDPCPANSGAPFPQLSGACRCPRLSPTFQRVARASFNTSKQD